jgi:hypothetical protein
MTEIINSNNVEINLENHHYNKLNERQSGQYEEIKSINLEKVISVEKSRFEAIKNRKFLFLLFGSGVIICLLIIAIGVILGVFSNKSNLLYCIHFFFYFLVYFIM